MEILKIILIKHWSGYHTPSKYPKYVTNLLMTSILWREYFIIVSFRYEVYTRMHVHKVYVLN